MGRLHPGPCLEVSRQVDSGYCGVVANPLVRLARQRFAGPLVIVSWLALAACPAIDAEPPPVGSGLDAADVLEVEPNDESYQALGAIAPPLVLGGTMSSCGANGSFAGSDVDRFSFSVAEPTSLSLRLDVVGGDLDMRLYDPGGDLMADEDSAGVDGEQVDLSIGPLAEYGVELRCWLGDEPEWRLRFGVGS